MQETRRYILDILRERGQATVDDIVAELQTRRGREITAVTVRHHLMRLQEEALITSPELRRRSTPGRPQHMYALTPKAKQQFPNNYHTLAVTLIEQMKQQLPPERVNVIFEGAADQMAAQAHIPALPMHERMELIVTYLTEHGYDAAWERIESGYILHTSNCPYQHISDHDTHLCEMDMRLITALVGVVPRRMTHKPQGDETCSYLIPDEGMMTAHTEF